MRNIFVVDQQPAARAHYDNNIIIIFERVFVLFFFINTSRVHRVDSKISDLTRRLISEDHHDEIAN